MSAGKKTTAQPKTPKVSTEKTPEKTPVDTTPEKPNTSKAPAKPKAPKSTEKKTVEKTVNNKSSRQQISKQIGINLSVSRVRKHIDKNNVNSDVESACAELKALRKKESDGKLVNHDDISDATKGIVEVAYNAINSKRKSDTPHTNTLEEKIGVVSKLRCRFSTDASVMLSSGLDYIVQKLVENAMENASSKGKAIIQVNHIMRDQNSGCCPVYALVNSLDVFQRFMQNTSDDDENDDSTDEHDTEEDDKNTSSFEFYVNLICKNIKNNLVTKNESFNSIRISKNIRKFCSELIIQLIERISPLIKLYSATAKIKTINEDVIRFIFTFLLMDAGCSHTEFCNFMDERLKVYHSLK